MLLFRVVVAARLPRHSQYGCWLRNVERICRGGVHSARRLSQAQIPCHQCHVSVEATLRRHYATPLPSRGLNSELIVQLNVTQRTVAIRRENRLDHVAALRPTEVQRRRKTVSDLVIGAHVIQIGELRVPVRRPALKAKRPRLKRTAAGIPKISAAR